MTLILLAYLGGILTIVSPCILPVLPFVFARADRPFVRNGLPMLLGMALTFAAVATLAAVAGGWVVEANQYGRIAALVLMALFGLTLVFPSLAESIMRPVVGIGAKLSVSAERGAGDDASIFPSLLLGVATGFLWAPCAGPVLGLILTGAALNGANVGTSLLLLSYAVGAATKVSQLVGGYLLLSSLMGGFALYVTIGGTHLAEAWPVAAAFCGCVLAGALLITVSVTVRERLFKRCHSGLCSTRATAP